MAQGTAVMMTTSEKARRSMVLSTKRSSSFLLATAFTNVSITIKGGTKSMIARIASKALLAIIFLKCSFFSRIRASFFL